MANPWADTIAARALFQQPADQFAASQNARTSVLLRLMQGNREEQLRRDLADQGYDRSLQLAGMQADREDARAIATERRQGIQLRALQASDAARMEAADTKQLRAAIASTYQKYAAEATRLGEKVRPITEFKETWEGLGDLQAEMARLEQTRILRDQDAASTAAIGELDDAARSVADTRKALERLQMPTPEDEKFARARAAQAVGSVIETGGMTGAPKSNSAAAKNGIAALMRGDAVEAGKLLGPQVLARYDAEYEAAMQAAPNFKSRMQQLAIAQKNYELDQRNLMTIQSDLRRAAAGNNSLATKLTTRRSTLQQLMAPENSEVAPKKPRPFAEIFGENQPPPPPPQRKSTVAPAGLASRSVRAAGELIPGVQALQLASNVVTEVPRRALTSPLQMLPLLQSVLSRAPEAGVEYLERLAAERREPETIIGNGSN